MEFLLNGKFLLNGILFTHSFDLIKKNEGALMVSNREENRESIQLSNESAGYLVCSGCDGFYELQEDETPEDFDKCECGSPLVYYKTKEELENRFKSSSNENLEVLKSNESIVDESSFEESAKKPSGEKLSAKEPALQKPSVEEFTVDGEISKNKNLEKVNEVKETSNTETAPTGKKTNKSNNKSPASNNKSAVDRLSIQKNISDDVLTNRKKDGKDLWDNLDELNSKNNLQKPQASGDHSIEMDRLMVMVDHKRTFEEKEKRFNSTSGQGKSPIMIIGVVIVLVVVVLALTMVLGVF